jgi:hypothetical protein
MKASGRIYSGPRPELPIRAAMDERRACFHLKLPAADRALARGAG